MKIENSEKYFSFYGEIIKDETNGKPCYHQALKDAINYRNLEIDLYWKRTAYFWAFIVLALSGYFLIDSNKFEHINLMRLFVSVVGFIFTFGWFLVNKGSKYWQENWETHVSLLERKVYGPMYMTVLGPLKHSNRISNYNAYPFSVTKINITLSILVLGVWFILFLFSGFSFVEKELNFSYPYILIDFKFLIKIIIVFACFCIVAIFCWKIYNSKSKIISDGKKNFMSYDVAINTVLKKEKPKKQ